jgi:hypothetical protein
MISFGKKNFRYFQENLFKNQKNCSKGQVGDNHLCRERMSWTAAIMECDYSGQGVISSILS